MKTYNRTLILFTIIVTSGIVLNAQQSETNHDQLSAKELNKTDLRSNRSDKIIHSHEQLTLRVKEFIANSKSAYKAIVDPVLPKAVDEAPSDSAYVYLWEGDWDLAYRIYYYFNALSIEILQEELNPDGTWSNFYRRILDFFNTGVFRRETESYWKGSVSDWQTGYLEEYNAEGRIIEVYSKNWNDTTQEFTEGFRVISSYKKDTLLETEIYQEWDVATKGWKNLLRIDNTYDANDLISGTLQSVWKDGDWRNDYSIDYDFNEFGDLTTETTQVWDTVGLAWINDVMLEREFNTLGNITKILRKQWDKGSMDWVNDVQQINNYDAFFQIESNLVQSWNGSLWIDSLRSSFSYTAEGDISLYLEELWDVSDWRGLYRESYTYSITEVSIEIDNWNTDSKNWENDILITYQINESGLIMVEQREYWNNLSSDYEIGYYDEYDEDGTNPEFFTKTWNDSLNKFTGGVRILSSYYQNATRDLMQRIVQEWDTVAIEWKNFQKTDYFWAPVSVESVSLSGSYAIYPMPFTGIIYVDTDDDLQPGSALKIFDLNGRLVNETDLTDKTTIIDLSYLKKGVYLAEISSAKGRSVNKLVKY